MKKTLTHDQIEIRTNVLINVAQKTAQLCQHLGNHHLNKMELDISDEYEQLKQTFEPEELDDIEYTLDHMNALVIDRDGAYVLDLDPVYHPEVSTHKSTLADDYQNTIDVLMAFLNELEPNHINALENDGLPF